MIKLLKSLCNKICVKVYYDMFKIPPSTIAIIQYKRNNWPQLFCVRYLCNLQIYIFVLPYHFQLTSKCAVCISLIYWHVKYFNKRNNIVFIVLWEYYGKVNLCCALKSSWQYLVALSTFYVMKTYGWKIPFVIEYSQICLWKKPIFHPVVRKTRQQGIKHSLGHASCIQWQL